MDKKYTVGIFPSGSEIGLEINNALKYLKNIEVIGLTSTEDHTKYVYKKYIKDIPFYNNDKFIDVINNVINENKIDFIYPAHDNVSLYLTENREKINAKIITSDLETVRICRSKKKTYEIFNGSYFIPKNYQNISDVDEFPIFIKPDIGQGSQGAKIIYSLDDLKYEYSKDPSVVICEFLPGEEYTIDCFTDLNGTLKVSLFRNRNRIKCGISVNSQSLELPIEVKEIAQAINLKLKFNGAWFFQLKKDKLGNFKLLEIATRIPGTMGLSRNKGINFPLLTIYNNLNIDTEVIENKFNIEVDRAFISRYKIDYNYDTVYVDFDDTIVIKEKINKFLIMFLYQCINENIKLVLITKHSNDLMEIFKKNKLCIDIFDEVIHISKEEEKAKFIKNNNSIFIDDSFVERKKVFESSKIPVFDLDEVEALIDWRV